MDNNSTYKKLKVNILKFIFNYFYNSRMTDYNITELYISRKKKLS